MHLLLPPSEAKNPGGRGRPLRERADAGPLAEPRHRAVTALRELVGGDAAASAEALLLPPSIAADAIAANAAVADARTTPALRRYAGVVYDGYDIASLNDAEQRVAGRSTWIFSGLFGVVRGDEPVPDYRVPAKAVLPGLGVAGTFWRPVLDEVMPALLTRGVIVDLRSTDYQAMWRPRGEAAERSVAIKVLSPAPRGGHAVISFTSKISKGRLAAALVRRAAAGGRVDGADDVMAAWRDCGGVDAEFTAATPGRPAALDLYTS